MAARPQRGTDALANAERAVRDFFEPQLLPLGLTVKQIDEQDLNQLEASLGRVNDAIANADAFGKIRLSIRADAGVVIVRADSEAVIERGILPILLERKALILDRINALRPEEQLNNLRADVADNIADPQAREQLLDIINRRFDEERAARENLDREREKVDAQRIDIWEREQRLQIEIRERRWAIYRSFIERESMASIAGAILLLAFSAALIISMFTHTTSPAVVTNAFLLILGYFFGQTTTRVSATRESRHDDG